MHVRCPHCHQPIEVVDDESLQDIECPSCGSSFNLLAGENDVGETTASFSQQATPFRFRQQPLKIIGHFELHEHLGQGHFGNVYKGKDTKLDRTVAVKIPRRDQLGPEEAELFFREARAAAQLKHPNIVGIHEVGREKDTIYIVSDFVQGRDLAEWLSGARHSSREAAELCVTIADALHHAHEAGVIHRDLKPANIMIDGNGEPYIMDFGLAKREAGEVTMTVEGKILGTPAYMSPEQAQGDAHNADRRSDVYSLGVILFELLTGERPFRGTSRMLLHQVIHDDAPSPRKLNNTLPRDLETICLKCLEKPPERRYPTADELRAELQRYLNGEPIQARPVSRLERSWRWCKRKPLVASLLASVSAMLLFLLVAGPVVYLRETSLRGQAETAAVGETRAANAAQVSRGKAERESKRAHELQKIESKTRQAAERNTYNATMLLVQREWEDANVIHFRELLNHYHDQDDLKGFEWSYWDRLAHSELFTIQGPSSSVIFSPDGTQLAAARGNEVTMWDAATGQELRTLKEHASDVKSVAFSPDGTRLAAANGNAVTIWDTATWQVLHTIKDARHPYNITSVTFSPNGTQLAATRGYAVTVWDAATGQELLAFYRHTSTVTSVAFNPDGTQLATASGNVVTVWDAAIGLKRQKSRTLKGHTDTVTSVAFNPDGTRLASASWDRTVKVWDIATGQELRTIKRHASRVTSVAFSPDGTRLASASDDETVNIWDAATGQKLRTLYGHSYVTSIAFSPDGTRLAAAGGNAVTVWDTVIGREFHTLKRRANENQPRGEPLLASIAFSPDGTRLASAGGNTVTVWDAATEQELHTLKGHANTVTSVAFSPDGTRLASASWDGTVKVWNTATGQELRTIKVYANENNPFPGKPLRPSAVHSVAFSPDGTRLAAAGGNAVKVWDAATGQELRTIKEHNNDVRSVAFSPDGTRLASAAQVWDAATGQELCAFNGHIEGHGVVFSPDGTRLATAGGDAVKVWDAATGQEFLALKGHAGTVWSVAFSPDGTRLASASWDRTVKVWDIATGQELLTLKGHAGEVWGVAFSPDGTRLASTGNDGTVNVWDARPWTSELRAEAQAREYLTVHRERVKSLAELREKVSSDRTISDRVRRQTLNWAELFWQKNR